MSFVSGDWISAWRSKNGYSQDQLAKELEVARQTVVKWEASEKVDRLVFLALRALEIDAGLQVIGARTEGRKKRRADL
jgi:transcriptional regulator with XRE-family HTH domain